MTISRTLISYHDLSLEVETSPGEELMEHMHATVMGQPGGFRYQHTNLADRMNAPGENYFMYLRKRGKMLGSVGFAVKPAIAAGIKHDSWLIRYFSIKAPMRVDPNKRKEKVDVQDENKRSSVLGRFVQPVAANPSWLRHGEKDSVSPAIIYGIIEQKNLRSMNFSTQMGVETVGVMASFSFSRLRPRKSLRMKALPLEEQASMLELLQDYYSDHTLFFPDPLFKNNDYYVLRESGRIVAGVQIYPVSWRIVDFGNGMANYVLGWLTKIPWVKKRINPEKLQLLAFDGIYCESGFEDSLFELMEGVMEHKGIYVGMLMMDVESHLYGIFENRRDLGLLHLMLGTVLADIRMRFINLSDEVRTYYLEHPTYIPTYDNS